jgi:hypothetical protein
MKRTLAAAAGLAVTGAVFAAAPAAADAAKDATLTWKISECAFAACPSLTTAQNSSGPVSRTADGWQFTGGTGQYDPATGATRLAFTGSVTLGNTAMGGYSISFHDPEVTVDAAGNGSLAADLVYKTSAASPETTVPDVRLIDLPAVPDATSWTVTPPWEGVGTPGTPAPVDGKQFAQPLIDALPASLKGWFWATGTTGSNLTKNPAPVGVSLTRAPRVTIEGAEGLTANSTATVTVRGTGFDPARRTPAVQGLYVTFGPDPSAVGYDNPDLFGGAVYLPTSPDGQGGFSTEITLKGRYTDGTGRVWDGSKQTLGISTWAAHSHAISDWDTFTPIAFAPTAKAASKTKASLESKTIRRGTRAVLKVAVRSDATVTGRVAVKRAGKVVAGKRMKAADKGSLRIRLPKQKVGRHTFAVVYRGTGAVARSSDTVVLRVRR